MASRLTSNRPIRKWGSSSSNSRGKSIPCSTRSAKAVYEVCRLGLHHPRRGVDRLSDGPRSRPRLSYPLLLYRLRDSRSDRRNDPDGSGSETQAMMAEFNYRRVPRWILIVGAAGTVIAGILRGITGASGFAIG